MRTGGDADVPSQGDGHIDGSTNGDGRSHLVAKVPRDVVNGVVIRVVGVQVSVVGTGGGEGEVRDIVDHGDVVLHTSSTGGGGAGVGLPNGSVGGIVRHRAAVHAVFADGTLEEYHIGCERNVLRVSDGSVDSRNPHAVVAVHHRGRWGISDHGFSVVQRFFLARPGVDIIQITSLGH